MAPKRRSPLCRIQSLRSEKEQPAQKIFLTAREMTNGFPRGAKAGNFQKVSFSKNREEIPLKSASTNFDTDSRKSILIRRYLV